MERTAGILMPIFSLPSPYGIGTLGKAAYEFVDFLAEAGQRWWQILPVGPTGFGDSPYQSFSTFAGNPYFIDPDLLKEDGLLTQEEIDSFAWGGDPGRVDYGTMFENRFALLRLAAARGLERDAAETERFAREQRWLPDYALYMAVKWHFGGVCWTAWPDEDIRLHRPAAVEKYRALLAEDVAFYTYLQYLFYRQWAGLRAYARTKNIGIIGDIPIYVALDSADVWSAPEFFALDEKNIPVEVAGVPPDYFTWDGQLWGNPLYDWAAMRADGYGWWIRRVDGAGKLYDKLRIDHFRAFDRYWAVPYGAKNAVKGVWRKGPGMELIHILNTWFPDLSYIAEDLGDLDESVHELVRSSGWPGMKVLEFAFDPSGESGYLPHDHEPNMICYTGTHDNVPLLGWLDEVSRREKRFAKKYYHVTETRLADAILRSGLASVTRIFVAQLQDYLGIGAEGRINVPGCPQGNWQWRLLPGLLTEEKAKEIRALAVLYGRAEAKKKTKAGKR